MDYRGLAYGRSARLLGSLLLTLAALALALPAPAPAYLYGTVFGVNRANLDGGEIQKDFIPYTKYGDYDGLALSGSYIYLTVDGSEGKIARANLEGGGLVPDLFTIPQPSERKVEANATSIAVAGPYLYWGEGEGPSSYPLPPREQPYDYWLGRAGINGAKVEPGFIKTEGPVDEVQVYENHIYWSTNDSIARANLDGRDVQENFIPLPSTNRSKGRYAVGEGHIYWFTEHGIARANLNGHGIDQRFITGLPYYVGDIAVGAGRIYWNAEESHVGEPEKQEKSFLIEHHSWLGRADADGHDVRPRLITFNGTKDISGTEWLDPEGLGRLAVNALGPGGISQQEKPPHSKHRRH